MKVLKSLWLAWALLLVLTAFSVWARYQLPDAPIATHFNGDMRPNGWMPRDRALAFPVEFEGVFLAVLTAAPWVLPPRDFFTRSAPAYGAICAAIVAFFCALQVGIVGNALHWKVGVAQVMPAALGMLFIVIGNYLSKIRYNFILGIRTPWTLSNEQVWDRTHRVAGPLFMLGGAFIFAAGVFGLAFRTFFLIGALAPAVLAWVYSWWLWSRLPDDEKRSGGSGGQSVA